MMPINVTHTAIVTEKIHTQLLSPGSINTPGVLPKASTNLRHTLSTLITYFAEAYKSTFRFNDGPPLHDALTIAYVAHPELFKTTRHRVDIELTGTHSTGETVVDVWKYRPCDDTWGRNGRNCNVVDYMDVGSHHFLNNRRSLTSVAHLQVIGFFDMFLEVVSACDKVTPLNK